MEIYKELFDKNSPDKKANRVLLIVALLAFALGILGHFALFPVETTNLLVWLNALVHNAFATVGIFTGQYAYDDVQPPKVPAPPALTIARLLAVLVIIWVALKMMTRAFPDFFLHLKIRRLRAHHIICGLDERALFLARRLAAKEQRVVFIEREPQPTLVREANAAGALVLDADVTSETGAPLTIAGLERASQIHILLNDDNLAIEVALRCYNLRKATAGSAAHPLHHYLHCTLYVQRRYSAELFKKHEYFARENTAIRFYPRIIANNQNSAYQILTRHAPEWFIRARERGTPPHILIVGGGLLGRALLLQLATLLWHNEATGDAAPCHLTVVDKSPTAPDVFAWQYPHLAPELGFNPTFITGDILALSDQQWRQITDAGPVNGVFFCVSDETVMLAATRLLQFPCHLGADTPIVLCPDTAKGIARLFGDPDRFEDKALETDASAKVYKVRNIHIHDITEDPARAHEDDTEDAARELHENFLARRQSELGDAFAERQHTRASYRPWAELPDFYRESNRAQARQKLPLMCAGYAFGDTNPWNSPATPVTEIASRDLDLLGNMEHRRWMIEKFADGYVLGDHDDDVAKFNHNLVPWEKLGTERSYDITPVLDIFNRLRRNTTAWRRQ
jgi:hypothetical protein